MLTPANDSAQVRFPPPLMLLLSILAGIAAGHFWRLRFLPRSHELRGALGILLCGGSLALVLYCARRFKKVGTAVPPWETSTLIVSDGPYGFSRNPIYLGFVIFGIGVACALNNAWIAAMMIPLMICLRRFVIAKEEAYLESKFGQTYLDYKSRVRRWI